MIYYLLFVIVALMGLIDFVALVLLPLGRLLHPMMVGTPWQLTAWAVFLVAQNASFTFVSRARNSGSYALHAVAALCSNGIWIAAQFVSLVLIVDTVKTGTWPQRVFVGAFYTLFTVIGSVTMHWVGVNFIEKGKRKVGA